MNICNYIRNISMISVSNYCYQILQLLFTNHHITDDSLIFIGMNGIYLKSIKLNNCAEQVM